MKKSLLGIILSVALAVGTIGTSVCAFADTTVDSSSARSCVAWAQIFGKNVTYSASFTSVPASDDGMVYLYELKTYEYSIPDGAQPIASEKAAMSVNISFPLNFTGGYGRLYNKFVLAVIRNGELVFINNPQYITNPEAVATNTRPRAQREAKALQEGNVANISLDGIGNDTPVGAYHAVFSNDRGDVITADPNQTGDTHPVKNNPIAGYALCADNDLAIEGLIAEMVNYAANTRVQDFVIGNEVNERCWNYMTWCDWDTYVRRYVQAFRVCYTAIKSTNANAMVYTSIDQVWDKNPTGNNYYEYIDGKDFMVKFNRMIRENGNIDWNMSIHPYPNPLYYPKFWDLRGVANGAMYKSQVDKDQVITFQNLGTLTGFLSQSDYLNRFGQVRDVIIGEIGMGTNAGEEAQAAGVCASYAAFEMNPYVTQYLYLEVDINGFFPTLKGKGLEAFNAMGTPNEQQYMDWAKSYIGISDWSEVLR